MRVHIENPSVIIAGPTTGKSRFVAENWQHAIDSDDVIGLLAPSWWGMLKDPRVECDHTLFHEALAPVMRQLTSAGFTIVTNMWGQAVLTWTSKTALSADGAKVPVGFWRKDLKEMVRLSQNRHGHASAGFPEKMVARWRKGWDAYAGYTVDHRIDLQPGEFLSQRLTCATSGCPWTPEPIDWTSKEAIAVRTRKMRILLASQPGFLPGRLDWLAKQCIASKATKSLLVLKP